jgi:hypothetical protein
MTTTYVYELCGPLIDDSAVTKHAYEHAQSVLAQRAPALRPGYPDTACGVDRFLYNRRTAAYRANAQDITKGWAWEHFCGKLDERADVRLLTSHQSDTVAILEASPPLRRLLAAKKVTGCTPEDRVWRLRDWALVGPVVYFCAPWWWTTDVR